MRSLYTLLAASLLLVAGCGVEVQVPDVAKVVRDADTVSGSCIEETAEFADAVTEVNSRLSVGLQYEKFHGLVSDASVAYDRIPDDVLDEDCIDLYLEPLRKAYNALASADSRWERCLRREWNCDPNKDEKIVDGFERADDLVEQAREAL